MVNHKSLTANNFWAPPGGGIEVGQSLSIALKQEFEQETGLVIDPGKFLFGCEFIQQLPLHAIELFFEVTILGGTLKVGHDPELSPSNRLFQMLLFYLPTKLSIIPLDQKHGIFKHCPKCQTTQRASVAFTLFNTVSMEFAL